MKKHLKLTIAIVFFSVIGTITAQIEGNEPVANAVAEKVLIKNEISAFEFFV
jgi:hypothetical protein